jgi:hypothetical protein
VQVRGPEDGENEGELVLLGNESATPGYLTLPTETRKYRPLSPAGVSTSTRFQTGDRFARVSMCGQEWLLYRCRQDDLLVHTSGEMTNPLPIEQAFQAAAPGLVALACCVGDGLPRPLLLAELLAPLEPNGPDEATRNELRAALSTANGTQPAYSRVQPQHVMLLSPGQLPRTVKGSAQRGEASKQYAAELRDALKLESSLPTLASPETDADLTFDSLATSSADRKATADPDAPDPNLSHLTGLMGAASIVVVMAHFGVAPTVALQSSQAAQRLHLLIDVGASTSLTAFLAISGLVAQVRGDTAHAPTCHHHMSPPHVTTTCHHHMSPPHAHAHMLHVTTTCHHHMHMLTCSRLRAMLTTCSLLVCRTAPTAEHERQDHA